MACGCVFATASAVAGATIDSTVLAIQTAGYTTVGDGGAAQYARFGASPPSYPGSLQSVDGTYWALIEDVVTLEMFGGAGDAVYTSATTTANGVLTSGTDNHTAIVNAMSYLAATATGGVDRGGDIQLQIGNYYCSQSIDLKHRFTVRGRNAAGEAGRGTSDRQTVIVFPVDTTGFYFSAQNTSFGVNSTSTTSSSGSLFATLAVESLGNRASGDRTKHGFQASVRFELQDVSVFNFPGDGVHADSGNPSNGNINFWRIWGGRITGNQNGVNITGGDTNGGAAYSVNLENNRAFGYRDNSFLGCDFYNGQAQSNGTYAYCSYNGNRYYALIETLATLQATQPDLDATVWALKGAGGVTSLFRAWTPGNTTEWTRGSHFGLLNNSGSSVAWGGYLGESDTPPNVLLFKNMSYNGVRSNGYSTDSDGARISATGDLEVQDVLLRIVNGHTGQFRSELSGNSGVISERFYAWNTHALGSGNGEKFAFYSGYKVDGTTKRPTGSVFAKATSSNVATNTTVGLEIYDATADAVATAVSFDGNTNTFAQRGGANGQFLNTLTLTELTTIAAATTTDTAIQIPANAVVLGVSVRVVTVIPTATAFDYGIVGATARYGSAIVVAANTTSPGTLPGPLFYAAATKIRFTPNGTPADNSGRVRVTVHYYTITPPTS